MKSDKTHSLRSVVIVSSMTQYVTIPDEILRHAEDPRCVSYYCGEDPLRAPRYTFFFDTRNV